MRRIATFIIIAILGLPVFTQTALMETELSFKVRNAKGVHPFGAYYNDIGKVNLANGNLMLKRTLVTRPGRAGFNLDLSLYYNSKIWDRNSTRMYVKSPGSWVGLGWYLEFPGFSREPPPIRFVLLMDPAMKSSSILMASGNPLIRPIFFLIPFIKRPLSETGPSYISDSLVQTIISAIWTR